MRAIVLVIDSFGIGALPDANRYGDEGSNTAGHICDVMSGEKWPALKRLGLGNAARLAGHNLSGCEAVEIPEASVAIMAERSSGKDTTTGHWELAGVILDRAFRTFPSEYPSFPADLISNFSSRIGRTVIGNRAASGTEIIEELGDEHLRSGSPIVYTSSDSVFQIAAHGETVSVDELYKICEVARQLCDPYRIGRVIARPFVGASGQFIRTESRRDFSMEPAGETLLDRLWGAGVETIGVGKIGDIFTERGLSRSYHDKGNNNCLDRVEALLSESSPENQLIFANLVDTDMIFGHRRNPAGYADSVSAIDSRIAKFREAIDGDDILVVTADHGCDPTYRGTDHTREYVPLLWYQRNRSPQNLGVRSTFSDLAQTISRELGAGDMKHGESLFR